MLFPEYSFFLLTHGQLTVNRGINFVFDILMHHELLKLCLILLPCGWNNLWSFGLLSAWRNLLPRIIGVYSQLFCWRRSIMAQMLVYHVSIDVWVWVNSWSSISGITQTWINMLFLGLSEICPLLHEVSDLSWLLFSLEVLLFDLPNPILILHPKRI